MPKSTGVRDMRWFRKKQQELGLSNNMMAELLCCTTSHVEHMRSGRRKVVDSTRKLIEATIRLKKID
jgi:hypothetical protein